MAQDIVFSYKSDSTVSGYTATLERLEIALLTEKGSVPADPDFGLGVGRLVDRQLTIDLQNSIKAEILQLVGQYFPDVEILSMTLNKPYFNTLQIKLSVRVLTSEQIHGLHVEFTGN